MFLVKVITHSLDKASNKLHFLGKQVVCQGVCLQLHTFPRMTCNANPIYIACLINSLGEMWNTKGLLKSCNLSQNQVLFLQIREGSLKLQVNQHLKVRTLEVHTYILISKHFCKT